MVQPSDRPSDQSSDPPAHQTADETSRNATPEPVLLTRPADGLPEVTRTAAGLVRITERLAAGTGPVALDAERAHGFRYSQRAYLIQLRRRGAGTQLIDPVTVAADQQPRGAGEPPAPAVAGPESPADLSSLAAGIDQAEWVLHAASQDLPCLTEVGLVPHRLFDTELAGRLLGYPRVNLGTLIEELFGVRLLKEHSAADWSIRPLPADWLVYATLDVELLIELRDALATRLEQAGKAEWARQEFAFLVDGATSPREPRVDPWRRTSGIHRIRNRRGLAVVAELWTERDAIARRLDRAPGRVLPDAAITELAGHRSPSAAVLRAMPSFTRRPVKRYEANWLRALDAALALSPEQLPPMHRVSDAPPQARIWASRDPVAAARLQRLRAVLIEEASRLQLPTENLLTPEHLRRLAWTPPDGVDEQSVDGLLAAQGARAWQREIVVPLLTPLITP